MSRERKVVLTIISTDKHCNNECPGIDFGTNPDSSYCRVFKEDLIWNEQRQSNGYRRLTACMEAETHKEPKTLREALENLLKEFPDAE